MNLFTIFLKKTLQDRCDCFVSSWIKSRDGEHHGFLPEEDLTGCWTTWYQMLMRFFSDWEKDWNLSSFIFRVSRWSLLVGQFTFLVLLILVTFSVFKVKNKCNVKYWNIWYYIVLQFLLNGIKLFWFSTCMSPLAWWSLLGASNQIQTCLNAWIEMTWNVWMSQQKLLFKENEACPIYPSKKSGARFLTYLNAWTKINEDK